MLLAALLVGATISAFAQSAFDNTFVRVGLGGQTLFGDHEKQMNFSERTSPALDIAVGKWFTPVVGVRVAYTGLSLNGATQYGDLSNGKPIDSKPLVGYWLYEQPIKYMHLHAEAMFNVLNWIGGNNPECKWGLSPYIGLGWLHTTSKHKTSEIGFNLGLNASYRLTEVLDLNIDVRGTLTSDDFDGEPGGRSGEGILGATIGVAYKF